MYDSESGITRKIGTLLLKVKIDEICQEQATLRNKRGCE